MTDTSQPKHRRNGTFQTKALAGLVAIMLAAAIIALVFVTSGGGSSDNKQAGAPASDVGRNSNTPTPTSSTSPAGPSSTAPTTKTASSTTASSSPATTRSKPATTSHSGDTKKVVYTVKKGDTLFDIGHWYSDHGYLKLYNWNKSVIGKNPNLIFPGQKIIVVDGHVGVARHHR